MKSQVAAVRCEDYDYNKLKSSVRRSLALIGGLKKIIKPGDNVLLKVNLIGPYPPERAATTHPAVVRAMCELIADIDAKAVIGESSGAFSDMSEIANAISEHAQKPKVFDISAGSVFDTSATSLFKVTGICQAAKEANTPIVNFEKHGYKMMKAPKGKLLKEVYFAKAVLDADVVVSLPKLKTHALALYTGAVKNFFGCVPSKERKRAHRLAKIELFSQSLVDIYSLAKCRLAVMDAVVGMEGNGPTHGKAKMLGAVISGYDAVAVDAVSSYLMGFNPSKIPHIRLAAEQGYGVGDLGSIDIIGDKIEPADFKKPVLQSKIVGLMPQKIVEAIQGLLMPKPYLDKAACTRCKTCMRSCPARAIAMSPYPAIDRKKCILCYCCYENCPAGAMELRKPYIGEAISRIRNKIGV